MPQQLSLAQFLSNAGVKVASAPAVTTPAVVAPDASKTAAVVAPVVAPVAAAPIPTTKVASKPAPKPAPVAPAPESKVASIQVDQSTFTPEQKWLFEKGVLTNDPKVASVLYAQQVHLADQAKTAELNKLAEEERNKGALQYQGMVRESTAMRLAFGEIGEADAAKIAAVINVPFSDIQKRASEAQRAQATSPALVGSMLGTAAHTSSSAAQTAAETTKATTEFSPTDLAGVRAPVSGKDEKLMSFQTAWCLPGNPGLNHGQPVDQGKGA